MGAALAAAVLEVTAEEREGEGEEELGGGARGAMAPPEAQRW